MRAHAHQPITLSVILKNGLNKQHCGGRRGGLITPHVQVLVEGRLEV